MHPQTLRLGTGAATALLLALSAQPAAAQANELPALIHACYVPNTGTIYRIKTEDTKDNCTSSQHIEFGWSQEGTLDHSELINLDQDDHPQYLLTEGVRESLAGFAVTGTLDEGSGPPASGAGVRLMWFPERAAFRVGEVTGTQWDLADIGTGSVATGRNTRASGDYSTAMGASTIASGFGSTAMGAETSASGSSATAMGFAAGSAGFASVAMGMHTAATGSNTTAMGRLASTNNQAGAFVYGDNSTDLFGSEAYVMAIAPNQFVVRAQRIWLGTNNNVTATTGRYLETSTGGYLSSGGSWVNASSRAAKENFRALDAEEVLRKVAEMEVPSWNYRSEEADVRHVGPVAQDFYRAFGLGGTDEAISTVDLGGVNMLAIQALERRTAELAGELEAVREENGALRRHNHELERRLARLEALLRPRMEPGASERP
jgi:trimeric autotransporter adhesin